MSDGVTEERVMLRRTARDLARDRAPVSQLRALRDQKDADGFSRELWLDIAALGLPGIPFPEECGGAGLGFAELGPVLEELGHTLAATPFVSSVLLAGSALLMGGTGAQRESLLPVVCAGQRILALAFQEGPYFAPFHVTTRAEPVGSGFRLTGEKVFVIDGHVADTLIVTARTSGSPDSRDGLSLFLIDGTAAGLSRQRTFLVDSRNAARVRLESVVVDRSAVVGEIGRGASVLEHVLDRATVGLCAEMLGGLQETFDRTLAYLKERRQFGVAIGSFQALKHRAARMYCELELARSAVADALEAIDQGRPDLPQAASVAKARCSDAFMLIANEAIQMHGGIGVTDELDIGFFLKRARVAEMTFGDSAWHRQRYATLEGF